MEEEKGRKKREPIISIETTYNDKTCSSRPVVDKAVSDEGWFIASTLVSWSFKTLFCLLIDHIKVTFQTDRRNDIGAIFYFYLTLSPFADRDETIRLVVEWDKSLKIIRYSDWTDKLLFAHLNMNSVSNAIEAINEIKLVIRQKLIFLSEKRRLDLVRLNILVERIGETLSR